HLVVVPSSHLKGIPVEVLTETVHPGRFIVSYAPSGTIFAWLQERRDQSEKTTQPPKLAHILAVGDPVLGEAKSTSERPNPPEQGAFLTHVTPRGTADKSGLK